MPFSNLVSYSFFFMTICFNILTDGKMVSNHVYIANTIKGGRLLFGGIAISSLASYLSIVK